MAQSTTYNYDVYQPRNPKASAYYKCVENHFEELERAWDDMYASRYGFWRTYVMTVIYRYLDVTMINNKTAEFAVSFTSCWQIDDYRVTVPKICLKKHF
jgi:hypothetical protein